MSATCEFVMRTTGNDTRDGGDALHTVAKLPINDTDPREQVRTHLLRSICVRVGGGGGGMLCSFV
jgi:hypothetical protein